MPGRTVKDKSSTAVLLPYLLLRQWASIIAKPPFTTSLSLVTDPSHIVSVQRFPATTSAVLGASAYGWDRIPHVPAPHDYKGVDGPLGSIAGLTRPHW